MLCHSTRASCTESVQLYTNKDTTITILVRRESVTCNMHMYVSCWLYTLHISQNYIQKCRRSESITHQGLPVKNHSHFYIHVDHPDCVLEMVIKYRKSRTANFRNCDIWFQIVSSWIKISGSSSNGFSFAGCVLVMTSRNSCYWLLRLFMTFTHCTLCILITSCYLCTRHRMVWYMLIAVTVFLTSVSL